MVAAGFCSVVGGRVNRITHVVVPQTVMFGFAGGLPSCDGANYFSDFAGRIRLAIFARLQIIIFSADKRPSCKKQHRNQKVWFAFVA
jgi:hypothetical protein